MAEFFQAKAFRKANPWHKRVVGETLDRLLNALDDLEDVQAHQERLSKLTNSLNDLDHDLQQLESQRNTDPKLLSRKRNGLKKTLRSLHEFTGTPYSSYWQRDSLKVRS